jgi:Protein of unknown function (DUF1574)
MKTVLEDSQQSLVQWVSQATGINTFGVKIRLRGNDLHILCEGTECPLRWRTLSDLLQALQYTNLDALTNSSQSIYQIFVYGRKKGSGRPQWCHKVYLNQLDRHLESVNNALLKKLPTYRPKLPGGALIVSNESLARQGHPQAIARYLSETLSNFGVSVNVKVRKQKRLVENSGEDNRLWVFCQSDYSPDVSLLAEPIAQRLRALKLSGYQDAIIAAQVSGEAAPDWLVRIDLTSTETMLKHWARWGDLQAISKLCAITLSEKNIGVQASLKESTIHLFCNPADDPLELAAAPDKTVCLEAITPLLDILSPQGILAATIYGQKNNDTQPAWIEWLALPPSEHPILAISPLELASSGDEEAINFLLERLLNPDLDRRLATGGIRALINRKDDLLHIMCDGPVCPPRKPVAKQVTEFIRNLNIPSIQGVRVYGRRAGNKEPAWQYGIDFRQRQRLVPEATPEFAATSAYVEELLPNTQEESFLRPDLTTEQVQAFFANAAKDWGITLKKWLINTHLFTEKGSKADTITDGSGIKVALVWGTLGLLLTLQTDWILGRIVNQSLISNSNTASIKSENQQESSVFYTNSSEENSKNNQESVFNASGFIQSSGNDKKTLQKTSPAIKNGTSAAILLAARSQIPTFNARQLDEQLALYKQRLSKNGKAPDILIIGSSRALRGVDPSALAQGLVSQGYPEVDVFNFGINGATAQVVDFILRKVLEESELPKMIIWADGARAFNSGREDITFKAIAESPGYQQAIQKALARHQADKKHQKSDKKSQKDKLSSEIPNNGKSINGYDALNDASNKAFALLSQTYPQRDQLKALGNKKIESIAFGNKNQGDKLAKNSTEVEENANQAVDFDGFLPLSIRFHPPTYYQRHPKVVGSYDNDYKSFTLAGEQNAALEAITEYTKSRNIPIVFVNMPLTEDYLDEARSNYEQKFEEYMLRVATQGNLIYRNLSKLFPKTDEYFSDPSHLNRYGAYEVGKKLASDPMIPWNLK